MNNNRHLMIKAALECQAVDRAIRECDFKNPMCNYRKKELALIRFYKYGGQRELLNLYKQTDLEEERLSSYYYLIKTA